MGLLQFECCVHPPKFPTWTLTSIVMVSGDRATGRRLGLEGCIVVKMNAFMKETPESYHTLCPLVRISW